MMPLAAKQNAVHLDREISSPSQVNDVHLGALVRTALDVTGTSYKEAAIAVGVSPPYFTAMLNDEKPWRLKQLKALPDAVERVFSRLYAESMGLTVIEPSDEQRVVGNLVSALGEALRTFGLPARAGAPLKAGLK